VDKKYGPHHGEVQKYISWAKSLTPTSARPLSLFKFSQSDLEALRQQTLSRLKEVDALRAAAAEQAGWDTALEAYEAVDFEFGTAAPEMSLIRAFIFAVSADELLTAKEKYELQYPFRSALGRDV